MKNFLKFLIFVVLVSLGISLLYDYRMKHGGLSRANQSTGEVFARYRAAGRSQRDWHTRAV